MSTLTRLNACATPLPAPPLHRQRPAPLAAAVRSTSSRWQRQQQRLQRTHAGTADQAASSSAEAPVLSDDEGLTSEGEEQAARPSTSGRGGGGGSMAHDRWRVPLPPQLHGKAPRKHWNANALAFLGDSVWELYARRRFFYPPSRRDSYFGSVVEQVRAETQERLCKQLLASGWLADTERDVLRWGRNATGVTPKRLSDTGLKRETYRAATAIECLCGYLYLSDPDRLHDMMSLLGLGDAPPEGSDGEGGGAAGGSTDGGSLSSVDAY